jgi:hypothetical protein
MPLLAGTAAVGSPIKLPEEANGFGTVKVVVGADYSWTKGKEDLSPADATALDVLLLHVNSSGDKVFVLGSNTSGSGKS